MDVNDFYNDKFNENDRLTQNDNRHKVELYRKRFLYKKYIDRLKPKSIVQIACGTGIHTHWLCENYPDIKIYASDIISKHVEQLKDYPNLDKRVWNCIDEVPQEYYNADFVFVEGAWYHLNKEDREKLLTNIGKINPNIVIIDWLSAWHDTTQRLLQDKTVPEDYKNPRPNEPFVFDTEADLKYLYITKDYSVQIFPVDMDLRFGYKDLNDVSNEEFVKYIDLMNKVIGTYDARQSYIMNTTEHGCYIIVWPKIW